MSASVCLFLSGQIFCDYSLERYNSIFTLSHLRRDAYKISLRLKRIEICCVRIGSLEGSRRGKFIGCFSALYTQAERPMHSPHNLRGKACKELYPSNELPINKSIICGYNTTEILVPKLEGGMRQKDLLVQWHRQS